MLTIAALLGPSQGSLRAVRVPVTANHFQDIGKFEADLWKIADNLRANSNLASNEYFMPIMGLIFLRHATNRFYGAKTAMEADKAAVIMLSGSIERPAPASLAGVTMVEKPISEAQILQYLKPILKCGR
jgi:hypothetical protein